jgi:hypothetical protein
LTSHRDTEFLAQLMDSDTTEDALEEASIDAR